MLHTCWRYGYLRFGEDIRIDLDQSVLLAQKRHSGSAGGALLVLRAVKSSFDRDRQSISHDRLGNHLGIRAVVVGFGAALMKICGDEDV